MVAVFGLWGFICLFCSILFFVIHRDTWVFRESSEITKHEIFWVLSLCLLVCGSFH